MSKTRILTLTTDPAYIYGAICHSVNRGGYIAHYQIVISLLFNLIHFIFSPLLPSGDLLRRHHNPIASGVGVCIGQILFSNY